MSNAHSFAHADAPRRHGLPTECDPGHAPLRAGTMERLAAWFCGDVALRRSEAHQLLESAVETGQIAHHRAEFVAAIKALAAGPRNWDEMGYRLLPDD